MFQFLRNLQAPLRLALLQNRLRHGGDQGRIAAAVALSEIGGELAVATLLEAVLSLLPEDNEAVREAFVGALQKLDPPGIVDRLCTALSSQDRRTRANAVRTLTRIGDARAIGVVSGAMGDPAEEVSDAAISALAKFAVAGSSENRSEAFDHLCSAAKDKAPHVRHRAVEALGNLLDPRAISVISGAMRDPVAEVSAAATAALAKFAVAGSSEDRSRAFKHLCSVASDKQSNVRYRAVEALGDLGDRRAIPAVSAALKDPSESGLTRCLAAGALAKLAIAGTAEDRSRAFDLLRSCLWPRHDDVLASLGRSGCILALGALRDPRSFDLLLDALQSWRALGFTKIEGRENPELELQAIVNAMGILGDKRAIEPLQDLLLYHQPKPPPRDAFEAMALLPQALRDAELVPVIREALGELGVRVT